MMRGIKTVKVIKDEKRLVRNMPIIIAILISLGAFGISYFSYLSSTEANAIAKQTLYNQEHADEIFNEKFYNHTNGKVLIYYPGNQTGDMRREQILMILNNTLPEGLKDVAFISSINIANAEQHAKIDLDNNGYKIRYRPQIERDNNLTNNSIFTWSRNIPSGDLFIILNVTWDKAWRQANIKEPNISFEMSAYDKPIKNLTIREVNESEITSRYRLLRPDLYP
jgi:hypothetical protein